MGLENEQDKMIEELITMQKEWVILREKTHYKYIRSFYKQLIIIVSWMMETKYSSNTKYTRKTKYTQHVFFDVIWAGR